MGYRAVAKVFETLRRRSSRLLSALCGRLAIPAHPGNPPLDRNDVVSDRRALTVSGPILHQFVALFQSVAPAVSFFGGIAYTMRQGELDQIAGEYCFIAGPIAEGRTKTVHGEQAGTEAP